MTLSVGADQLGIVKSRPDTARVPAFDATEGWRDTRDLRGMNG